MSEAQPMNTYEVSDQDLIQGLRDEIKARQKNYEVLRDERDRLSAALLNVRVAWNNKNETTSLHVWHERMKAAMADVEAAMTPARGQELEDK